MTRKKLTVKQQAFADYYIKSTNATESAVLAGYSKKTAAEMGYENLNKPQILEYIDKQLKEMADERIMGVTEALELLTSIARGETTEEVYITTEHGMQRVDKTPEIKDRQRAIDSLLKRYPTNKYDELRNKLMEAQIKKAVAETKNEVEGTKKITIIDNWIDAVDS